VLCDVEAAQVVTDVGQASLMHGLIPVAVQALAGAALLYAIGRQRPNRMRRWWTLWVPLAVVAAVVTFGLTHWYYGTLGLASEPPPWQLWLWVSLVGLATALAVFGWRGVGWGRRNVLVFAASFCLLSTGLVINGWLGYFPTVRGAVTQLAGRPLPNQIDLRTAQAMQAKGVAPHHGALVAVTTSDRVSGFSHRGEWVYLPPAWFTSPPPPPLPPILMIGGEFNTTADWVRAGDALSTLDTFAAAHGGYAPVVVFADATSGFTVDTECVNGVRGNAADHLTAEVIPEVGNLFGLNGQRKWEVVGFSSGGTCAVDLAVMHPELFSAFVDIGGDIGPNAGTRDQTIDRLFGGDANAYWWFDPATAIVRHGRYAALSGLFALPGAADGHRAVGHDAAETLCKVGAANGIDCKVVALPGKHDWPSAATAFEMTLPWLAERIELPTVTSAAVP
jgi:S-formylglutathione hydrolase FrmB